MYSTHRINIFGNEIAVRSTASAESVKEIEAFVNDSISNAAASVSNVDHQIVLILALMNIAESYIKLLKDNDSLKKETEAAASRLLHRIDEID